MSTVIAFTWNKQLRSVKGSTGPQSKKKWIFFFSKNSRFMGAGAMTAIVSVVLIVIALINLGDALFSGTQETVFLIIKCTIDVKAVLTFC